jgi:hypothetical protein
VKVLHHRIPFDSEVRLGLATSLETVAGVEGQCRARAVYCSRTTARRNPRRSQLGLVARLVRTPVETELALME